MSRHRNVRSLNYSDECEGLDDVYGHSVEDDYSISPSVAEQFIYDRTRQSQMSAFIRGEAGIAEEDEEGCEEVVEPSPKRPQLNDIDEARLQSCLDEIRSIVGDTAPEHMIVDAILRCGFDIHRALDAILNSSSDKGSSNAPTGGPDLARDKDERFHLTDTVRFLKEKMSKMHIALPSSKGFETQSPVFNAISNVVPEVPVDVTNNEPGSLLALMAQHKSPEPMSDSGSLFTLMAKHNNEDETKTPVNSLFSLMSQHDNQEKSKSDFTSFADLSAHYLQSSPSPVNFGNEKLAPIDLSCALLSPDSNLNAETEEVKTQKCPPMEIPHEFPDNIYNKENYQAQYTNQIPRKLKIISKRPSELGHVVCRQWSNRFIPYRDMYSQPKTVLIFKFNTPSPDDVILKALKKVVD